MNDSGIKQIAKMLKIQTLEIISEMIRNNRATVVLEKLTG